MSSKERVVYAIIKFLASEAASNAVGEEAKEGIEVAKQCLESAYGLEADSRNDLELGVSLEELVGTCVQPPHKEITEEMKAQAEALKAEGNEHMKVEKYQEAVEAYSKAIEQNPSNAIYFSNRAAAFNKLNRFYEAVDDCDEAIAIDPKYSKAYGRKGLALSGLNQHTAAIDNYKKAIDLDPNNENFKTNLEIAQEKARTSGGEMAGGLGSLLGGGGAGGLPDISILMSNPAMMEMASRMMQNPGMQQMMNSFMANMQQQQPGAADSSATPGEGPFPGGMEHLLRAGQQFAENVQRTNPELVDQLRSQFQGGADGRSDPNDPSGPQS